MDPLLDLNLFQEKKKKELCLLSRSLGAFKPLIPLLLTLGFIRNGLSTGLDVLTLTPQRRSPTQLLGLLQ